MSKEKRITLIDIRYKNLLIKSDICQKDTELKEFLLKISERKGVTNLDIQNLQNRNKRLYELLNSEDSRQAIIKNSFGEWKPDKPNGVKKIPCQLCGNPKSEEKIIIKNIMTNEILQVGTSCIGRFPEKNRIYLGEDVLKIKRYTEKQINNLTEFNNFYGLGYGVFNLWAEQYTIYKLTMPNKYDTELKDIIDRGKKYYKNFRDDKLPKEQTINTFRYYIKEFNILIRKCELYEKTNIDNKYICDKGIENYLLRSNLSGLLSKIKDKDICVIGKDEAKWIYNIDFVNKFEKNIRNMFKKVDLKLKSLKELVLLDYFYKSYTESLELEINLKDFVNNFSEIYYNEIEFDKYKIFSLLNLKNNINNVKRFIDIIEGLVKHQKYYLQYNIKDSGEEIELHKRGTNKIALIDFEDFSIGYLCILTLNDKDATDFLIKKFNSLKWIDRKEKDKFDIGNISSYNTRVSNKQQENEFNKYESEEEYYQRINKNRKNTMKI